MAERDKVIKSGQLTLPRLLFLAVIGGIIVATVALGGIFLAIGYWLVTIAICVLLYLIATDYGVHIDKIDPTHQAAQAAAIEPAPSAAAEAPRAAAAEAKAKRRPGRPVKRRR